MFYDQSTKGNEAEAELFQIRPQGKGSSLAGHVGCGEGATLAPSELEGRSGVDSPLLRSAYEREVVESVWAFAEIVPGVDAALWRRDEFGDWIRRLDYGRRGSVFGWEIFDPGIGRHSQGVYAMRPLQWESYVKQYEAFA